MKSPYAKFIMIVPFVIGALGVSFTHAQQAAAATSDDDVTWVKVFDDRDQVLADYPIDRLEALYLGCVRESESRPLDGGEAAACSIIYEAFKERRFAGDFDALHAWWKSRRDAAAERTAQRTD